MPTDEAVRLKDELDSVRMKCAELNKALCEAVDENKKLKAVIGKGEEINADLRSRVRFLEGQVEAYQYCLNCRR